MRRNGKKSLNFDVLMVNAETSKKAERKILITLFESLSGESALMEKRLLMLRKKLKARKPEFVRCESWRYIRVKPKWRRPRGIDNKMREKIKGWPKSPNVGYRAPKIVRCLHPSGFKEVIVYRPEDLEGLNPEVHAVRIAGTVGNRKAFKIMELAEEKGLWILNPRMVKEEAEEELAEEIVEVADIEKAEVREEGETEKGLRLSNVDWIEKESVKKLEEIGILTLEALAEEEDLREISEITGISIEKLEEWARKAREIVKGGKQL